MAGKRASPVRITRGNGPGEAPAAARGEESEGRGLRPSSPPACPWQKETGEEGESFPSQSFDSEVVCARGRGRWAPTSQEEKRLRFANTLRCGGEGRPRRHRRPGTCAAAPAGAVLARWRTAAPRRHLRAPGCGRARRSSLCRHEPPAASVCRWRRRRRRGGPRRHARGRGPALLLHAAPSPRAHSLAASPGRRSGKRENRFSSTSPPLCHSLQGAERASGGRGPRGGLGTRAPLRDLGSGTAHAFLAQLCASFASGPWS